MNLPAVLTASARDDLRAELRWIGPDRPKARRLRDAVQTAARLVGSHPLAGRSDLGLLPAPYRFWSLPAVRLAFVYDASTEPPRILRLLSTAKDFAPLLAGIGKPRAG